MTATICFVLIILAVAYAYRLIINACKHEWDTIKEQPMIRTTKNSNYPYNIIEKKYISYHIKCKKCGNITHKDMI